MSKAGVLEGVPIMTFDERFVEFGKVKKGETRTHIYSFINKGDTPLEIDIISACDCTTVLYEEGKVYAPGEKGTLRVTFDSSEKDEEETIDIDILLKNTLPGTDIPIIEVVKYHFDIEQ